MSDARVTDIDEIANRLREAAIECLREVSYAFAGTGRRVRSLPADAGDMLALLSDRDALKARLEEAERERDEATGGAEAFYKQTKKLEDICLTVNAERDALAGLLGRAAEALEPFSAKANETEECAAEYGENDESRDPNNWALSCEWPDLCRARAALTELRAALASHKPAEGEGFRHDRA